jgi:ammonia channel protein AmtB
MGAVAERGRLIPALVFIFCWATLVYCPIACWAWNINGWGFKYGVLDYAGGGPVEIGSGLSALAYSMVLGKRQEKMMLNFRPHNVSLITLGTILLWFGWLGFNGGSAFGANLRAVMACWNSCLAGNNHVVWLRTRAAAERTEDTSPSAWTVTLLIYTVVVDHVQSPERSNAPRYSFVLLMYCWCLSRESRVAPTGWDCRAA